MDITIGVLLLVSSLIAGVVPPADGGHVRTVDPTIRATIDAGSAKSPSFRALIAQLDASDVIVYGMSDCSMPSFLLGRTTFMSTAGGRRYVLVAIACTMKERVRISMLGHELRHALEIAEAPSIVDQTTLAAEYRRIGFMSEGFSAGTGYDSRAAIEMGRRVWAEVGREGE
jgi:hypothetical protein